MLALEWKLGITPVIEFHLGPTLDSMTILALLAIPAFVYIILFVARKTGLAGFFLIGALFMAGVARYVFMSAVQGKLGVGGMIEYQFLPLIRAVALGTHPAITSVVGIIDQMTADTLLRRILVVIVGMTQFTIQVSMLTGEWIFSIEVMIKGLFSPALLVMAGITLLTEFSIVGIVGFVTIETQ